MADVIKYQAAFTADSWKNSISYQFTSLKLQMNLLPQLSMCINLQVKWY